MSFAQDFVWGAAASSYQIEGAANANGKGLSVWDQFCQQPGNIWSGHSGDVACDHYHRYEEDIRLMAGIGLQAYRLSISWPRVLPNGVGQVNAEGIGFYDRLIDALLEHQINPWVTLFHWDYPSALFSRGGWLNRDSADWFADYTAVIVDRLSDRVSHWITQNEPQCYIGLGHQSGEHAPGLQLELSDVLLAAHHSLLAHGKAVQVIRAQARSKPRIGTASVSLVKIPDAQTPEDIEAARQAMFAVTVKDCWNNTWFNDPIVLGQYPDDGIVLFSDAMPEVQSDDMQIICQPLDFFGANIYSGTFVMAANDGSPQTRSFADGSPMTTMEWDVTPGALYWGPKFYYERYGLPIVVTENGMANTDWIHADGSVHDPQRIDFLSRYLQEYARSIEDGVQAEGYFLWSILDNFEWAHGYKRRFGIVYVDYASGKRTLKDSALWYKRMISSHGKDLFVAEC